MKLVLATPLYPPEPGGPATYAKLLAERLPAEGIDVTLVPFSTVRAYPKVVRHTIYMVRVFRAALSADIVLALDPVSVGFPALLAARLAGKPILVKIVGDFAWEQGSQRFGITSTLDEFALQGRVPFPVAVLRAVQVFVAHHAMRVVVPSKYLEGVIKRWGIPQEKMTVIYNSIDMPDMVDRIALNENVVVSVGRFVPWKGMSTLIKAVATVRENHPDISLALVGDGPDRHALEKEGTELLGDRISFAGARSHEETLEALRASGIFVLNSTYEGLSHTLIEALMLGCAIVTSDAGGNTELISDGQDGLVVPSGDTRALAAAIERVLTDTSLRERLRTNAAASGSRFLPEQMIRETSALLKEAVRIRRKAPMPAASSTT